MSRASRRQTRRWSRTFKLPVWWVSEAWLARWKESIEKAEALENKKQVSA